MKGGERGEEREERVIGIRLTGNRGSHLRVHDLSRARRRAYNYTLNLDLLYAVMSTVGGGTDRLHGNIPGPEYLEPV